MRERAEYVLVWLVVRTLGALPWPVARWVGVGLGNGAYLLAGKLRRTGMRNLTLAFPDWNDARRRQALRVLFRGLGRQLADFCQFPGFNADNVASLAIYDGFENYETARRQGKGILLLTGHFGGWEIGSFAHSIYGHPMRIVVRQLDNPRVDRLVDQYRTLHGNQTFAKDNFVRGILGAMKAGEVVGILMDTNMTPPQGVFVPFFGRDACTAAGLAGMALKTGAAVLPGFTLWDPALRKYRIRFDPALELVRTGNTEADIVSNTALFTKVIEEYARKYPEQWLWVHRRWKTRPEGEPPMY
jgi:KDO2-lipid IV(A) lauroyltransferase